MLDEKYESEMRYWRERHRLEGTLGNGHYKDLMLRISGEHETFFKGKSIADFGCGPRGSLEWATDYAKCYCIDVLVDEYKSIGIDSHKANYIKSSENEIPLPTDSMDVIFSLNSLDHATNWVDMLDECIRILRPGGLIAMSINIDEPPSPSEPNTLTINDIKKRFKDRISVQREMASNRSDGPNKYLHLLNWAETGASPPPYNGAWGIFWVSGTKI